MVTFKDDIPCEYEMSSNEALTFKIIFDPDDLKKEKIGFKPDMSHQVFGDAEVISGYKNPRITLYYMACSFKVFYQFEHDGKNPAISKPLDPFSILNEKLELEENILKPFRAGNFLKDLPKDHEFSPFGTKLSEFVCDDSQFEIYRCTFDNEDLRMFHQRLDTLLLFFVDGASFIDQSDPNWSLYIVYHKKKSSLGKVAYCPVAYQTSYEYWAYWNNIRPRLSQVVVLPPYQRKGIALKLLKAFYNYYALVDNVTDLNVEDPNEPFQRIRDYYDCTLALSNDEIAPFLVSGKWDPSCHKFLNKVLKLNKRQSRRVFEILRLLITDPKDMDQFRVSVKQRLAAPYARQLKDTRKVQSALLSLNPSNAPLVSNEAIVTQLDGVFQETIEQYTPVVDRLKKGLFDRKLREMLKSV